MSLHVRLLLASKAKAQRPAAIGAEADVPKTRIDILVSQTLYYTTLLQMRCTDFTKTLNPFYQDWN